MSARPTGVRAVAGSCELVWVDGPDAEGFLQGLLTNDVSALAAAGSCHALILDGTGHIRGEMRVSRGGPTAFTLVTDPGQGEALVRLLDEYHFSEDVEVIGPETFAIVTLIGDPDLGDALTTAADLVLPGRVPGTLDAIGVGGPGIAAAAGATPAPEAELEVLRVEAGVPRFGVDFTSANLVQEAGLEPATVSFEKGCYLGQETVARVRYRGQVNRRLRGIVLPRPATVGAAVSAEGRPVGSLTSAAVSPGHGPIGLAILRREVAPGDAVRVEGIDGEARVVDVPFRA